MASCLEDELVRDLPLLEPGLFAGERAAYAPRERSVRGDLDSRLRELEPDAFASLDAVMRWLLDSDVTTGVRARHGSGTAFFAVLAMARDGRERERAVRALAESPGSLPPYALAALLVRANDWVDEVSTLATRALQARLAIDDAEAWVAVLGLLATASRSWRRRSFEQLEAGVLAKITSPESAPSVARGLLRGTRSVRRACASLGERSPVDVEVLEAALGDTDPRVVRLVAAELVRRARDQGADTRAALSARLERGGIELRVLALGLRASLPDARTHLLRVACDAVARVREEARFLHARAPGVHATFEFREYYLLALEGRGGAGEVAEGVLRGLVETAKPSDLPRFLALTRSPLRFEREAAFHALVRIGGRAQAEAVEHGLADPSARVRRAARRVARAHLR